MPLDADTRCTAFAGVRRIASGALRHVAMVAQRESTSNADPVRVFDDRSGRRIELALRGTSADLLRRLSDGALAFAVEDEPDVDEARTSARRGPGRPRLGVVSREVTLLPRHWRWLAVQPGGASMALRALVDAARGVDAGTDRTQAAREATWRFIAAMAGDTPGFEDAARALFAGDAHAFEEGIAAWPDDVRDHATLLAREAFEV